MSSLVNCSIVQVKCKRLEEKNLGGPVGEWRILMDFDKMRFEEQGRDWKSRDEIKRAETRLEEQRRDWKSRVEIDGAE